MDMLLKKRILGFCFIASAMIWTACSENPSADDAITDTQDVEIQATDEEKKKAEQVKVIFRAVPSPMEMASLLKKAGAQYDASLLNDVKNVNTYSASRSQALNLGIYGADLSYASVFNQNQESIIYLSCAKKLADNLGVSKAFDDETIERMEVNIDNRDSLLNIVSETYYMLDAYLKDNGREHISAMVVAAGWIEGLHISTSVATRTDDPSDALLTRIFDQKVSLNNLIELVEAYNKDNQLDEIYADLMALRKSFNTAVSIEKGASDVSTASDGVAVIGAKTTTKISPGGLKLIHNTVSEIRLRYVS
jgi:hypothetical protein